MRWTDRQAGNWVSKTDVSRYYRCPYAWYLVDRREVPFEETINELQLGLIADGQRFHITTEGELEAKHVSPDQLASAHEALAAAPGELWVPAGLVENTERKLCGIPDGVLPADGALYPIEIKSHAKPTPLDRLELAFYWLLLEELRPSADIQPLGFLYLRTIYGLEEIEVELDDALFADLASYIARIRNGRIKGVRPRICDCPLCTGPRREEVLAAARAGRDITLINGIGRKRADWLERIGITSWADLLTADIIEVQACLRAHEDYVGMPEIEQWHQHARSYELDLPIKFGEALHLGPSFLAIDLEYTTIGGLIWLTGVAVVDGDSCEYHMLWAHTPEQLAVALQKLARIAADHPAGPIVTWSGTSADIPALAAATRTGGLDGLLDQVFERHVDVYQHARRSNRWPIPELTLKALSAFLNLQRRSTIANGFEALSLFYEATRTADPDHAAQLTWSLTEYLQDDLDCLVSIAQQLAVSVGPREPPLPRQRKQTDAHDHDNGISTSTLVARIDARIALLRDEESRLRAALTALRSS